MIDRQARPLAFLDDELTGRFVAAELVHLGQLAMMAGLPIDCFVDGLFNFPTLAEAYRVAALQVIRQRGRADVQASAA